MSVDASRGADAAARPSNACRAFSAASFAGAEDHMSGAATIATRSGKLFAELLKNSFACHEIEVTTASVLKEGNIQGIQAPFNCSSR